MSWVGRSLSVVVKSRERQTFKTYSLPLSERQENAISGRLHSHKTVVRP